MDTQPMRIDELLRRIQAEYLEMPGLRLTTSQAQKLWGLDRQTCDALLAALLETRFLRRTRDGAFVRSDTAADFQLGDLKRHAAAISVA